MYKQYRDTSRIEIQDLQSVCMIAFLNAVHSFKGSSGFYTFWKSIATRDMIEEIKITSIKLSSNGVFSDTVVGEENDLDLLVAEGEDVSVETHRETLVDQVIYILFNSKYKISKRDANMFLLYINGYSFKEIAEQNNMQYANVRLRIYRVIDILRTILIKR